VSRRLRYSLVFVFCAIVPLACRGLPGEGRTEEKPAREIPGPPVHLPPLGPPIDAATLPPLEIGTPPDYLDADPFYTKHVDVGGVPVLASDSASDESVLETAYIMRRMTEKRYDLLQSLACDNVRIVVMGVNEMTTDLPEQRWMKPTMFWDLRARGLGGRITSGGEENLLNLPGDRYATENILLHEFAHCMHGFGARKVDPSFDIRLRTAYDEAMKTGLWKDTYASTNMGEYWAEGVQSWFETNRANDFLHNHVDTRQELKDYDPKLAALVEEIYGDREWTYRRYDVRTTGIVPKFRFARYYADGTRPPVPRFRSYARADFDLDGNDDLVIVGKGSLSTYRLGGRVAEWKRARGIGTDARLIGTAVVTADLDGDGDEDVITNAQSGSDDEARLVWCENPGPSSLGTLWKVHEIESAGFAPAELVELAVLEKPSLFLRSDELPGLTVLATSLRRGDSPLATLSSIRIDRRRASAVKIDEAPVTFDLKLGSPSALTSRAHLDHNGAIDVAFAGAWYRNPGRHGETWERTEFSSEKTAGYTELADFDGDGDLDCLRTLPAETGSSRRVVWLERPKGAAAQEWKVHEILDIPETAADIVAGDFDKDGDADLAISLVVAESPNDPVHFVRLYENPGPTESSKTWESFDISGPSFPLHRIEVVDLDGEGRVDLFGLSPFGECVSYYENISPVAKDE